MILRSMIGALAANRRRAVEPPSDFHKYWRLQCTGSPPVGDFAIEDLQFRTSIGGPSATVGGVPIASDYYNEQFRPENAFDSNPASQWVSTQADAWIGYNFPAPVKIVEYAMANVIGPHEMPHDWTVAWSDDGIAWTVADTRTGVQWGTGTLQAFEVSNTPQGAHRYWSMKVTGMIGGSELAIPTFRMRATIGGTDLAPAATAIGTPSTSGPAYAPAKAFDNNDETFYFVTPAVGARLGCDFGTPVKIAEYELLSTPAAGAQLMPRDWVFQWSDDGANWTTADTRTDQIFVQGTARPYLVPSLSAWNPDKKGSSVVLSNGNRTASVSLQDTVLAIKKSTPFESRMFEVTVNKMLSQNGIVGVGGPDIYLNAFLGSTSGAWGYFAAGIVFAEGATTSGVPPFQQGDVIGMRIDATGQLLMYQNGVYRYLMGSGFNERDAYPAVSSGAGDASRYEFTLNTTGPFSFPVEGVAPWE